MERREFIKKSSASALLGGVGVGAFTGCSAPSVELKEGEVLHTVLFDLKYPKGSPEAVKFMQDGVRILTSVPGVKNFQAYEQRSPKNPDYSYGFLMQFGSQAEFDAYTAHPDHCKFVAERWDTEVVRFQESDFVKGNW